MIIIMGNKCNIHLSFEGLFDMALRHREGTLENDVQYGPENHRLHWRLLTLPGTPVRALCSSKVLGTRPTKFKVELYSRNKYFFTVCVEYAVYLYFI